jgi:hypothetical protein
MKNILIKLNKANKADFIILALVPIAIITILVLPILNASHMPINLVVLYVFLEACVLGIYLSDKIQGK